MTKNVTTEWGELLHLLQTRLRKESYQTWIAPLKLREWNSSHLVVTAPSRYAKQRVEDDYLEELLGLARKLRPETESVRVLLEKETRVMGAATLNEALAATISQATPEHSATLDCGSTPRQEHPFSLDTFVVGPANRLGYTACLSLLEPGASSYNPLLLCGGSGSGKTHLLYGLSKALRKKQPGASFMVLSAEDFANAFVQALQDKKLDPFRQRMRGSHGLFMDDVQFLAGKEKTQEEFLHTFDSLLRGGRQVVLACDTHPQEIKRLDPRLAARLQSGLMARLAMPNQELRVELLRAKALARGLSLTPEILEIVALRVERTARELEGVICKLAALSAAEGRAPDRELALTALRELGYLREGPLHLGDLLAAVAQRYHQSPDHILSDKRHASLARSRHLAMYLAKQLTTHSLSEIGRFFGNRDHSTVLHGCRKIEALVQKDAALRAELAALKSGLGR